MPQDSSPILAEVVRGSMVESRHHASVAVVDAHGGIVRAWGDVELPIYGRSAIKPLLAIPLVESGAADRFKLGTAEIALATASHGGEPRHVEAVTTWLHRVGLGIADLECAPHYPYHEPSARLLVQARQEPTRGASNGQPALRDTVGEWRTMSDQDPQQPFHPGTRPQRLPAVSSARRIS